MDLTNKWKFTYLSICLIQHFDKNGHCLSSGTGFKIQGNRIVTNNHVFVCQSAVKTEVSFFEKNGTAVSQKATYDATYFNSLLIGGDPVDGWDFALISSEDFNTIPGLTLAKEDYVVNIGSQVFFLGFPLQSKSLSIHGGNISSKYSHNSGVKYINLDASVNAGNSGGPLIDFDTDCVIGLVTRKNTGLTEKFSALKKSFSDNINELKSNSGFVKISGIDPVETFRITQAQFDLLSEEIFRSSNVGIGYAFELDLLRTYL